MIMALERGAPSCCAPPGPSWLGWQKRAKNHGNTFSAGNVTQTGGCEPITGMALAVSTGVTQPVTLSLLRKSRYAGEYVTVLMLGTSFFNTLGVKGGFCPFLPT
jgi:hypothetical protein